MAGFGSLAPSIDPATGLPDVGDPLIPDRPFSPGTRAGNALFGLGSEPRFQTWPEKLLRSGVTLAHDVGTGEVPTHVMDPVTGEFVLNPEMILRAQDMAGLAGGGMMFGRLGPTEATLGAGPVLPRRYNPLENADQLKELANQRRAKGWATGESAPGWNFKRPDPEPGTLEWNEAVAKGAIPPEPTPPSPLLSKDDLDFIKGGGFYSDTATPGAPLAALEHAAAAPPFYSGVERALGEFGKARAMPGEAWASALKNRGAKPEEMDWRGVTDFLKERGNQQVTKDELAAHLDQNKVEIRAIDKEAPSWEQLSAEQQYEMKDRYRYAHGYDHTMEDVKDWYEQRRLNGETPGGPKWGEYQLPGGENYRERVLTMPERGGIKYTSENVKPIDPGTDTTGVASDPARFWYFKTPDNVLQIPRSKYPSQSDAMQYVIDKKSPPAPADQNYAGGHWQEKNVIVHRRSNERIMEATPVDQIEAKVEAAYPQTPLGSMASGMPGKAVHEGVLTPEEAADWSRANGWRSGFEDKPGTGVRTLHAEEIQSDLHQTGRKEGYKGSPAIKFKVSSAASREPPMDFPTRELADAELARRQIAEPTGYHNVMEYDSSKAVPDFPFKESWHRLAMNDMIREAAEKGFDRVSWTGGKAQSSNPKNLGRSGPEAEKTERGLMQHYDEKLVNYMNKVGKPHGVEVKHTALRNEGPMSGEKALQILGRDPAEWENIGGYRDRREQLFEEARAKGHTIHYMDIPPSLKEQALKRGFSLFEDAAPAGAPLAALEHAAQHPAIRQAFHDEMGPEAGQTAYEQYLASHGPEPAPAAAQAADTAAGGGSRSDVTGGGGGGDAGLAEAQAAAARRAGAEKPLEGLPTKAMKIGDEYFVPGPVARARDVAKQYMATRETPSYHTPPTKYHPLDEEHSRAIARAFDEMPHTPDDPATKASYDALIKETLDQYRAVKASGLKVEPIPQGMPDPYAKNPRLAAKDVADNNHLWFFPTEGGFGSDPGAKINMATHPMMQKTGEKIGDRELLANDVFRIVHDYFGHIKEGYGFRASGEDNAWRSHASMYSDIARPAMTTETRGQNSWVNYGPHGEHNRTASGADTKYADQKVGLMPEWTMRDRGSPEPTIAYHGSPFAFEKFDPTKIGTGEGADAYGQGLYFAGHEPVSDWYRHQLAARRDPVLKKYGLDSEDGARIGMSLASHHGDPSFLIKNAEESLRILRNSGDTDKATKNMIASDEATIAYLKDPERAKGHMYQVAIDQPAEKFLDWDKPLAQQSEQVRRAIEAHPLAERLLGNDVVRGELRSPTGEAIVSRLGGRTQSLKEGGLAGIRYLDQGSRGLRIGQPAIDNRTHNYVTFEAPRILKRYAVPLTAGAAGFGSLAPSREE